MPVGRKPSGKASEMTIDGEDRRRSVRRAAALISVVALGGGAWFAASRSGSHVEAPTGAVASVDLPAGAALGPAPAPSTSASRPPADLSRLTPEVRAAVAAARADGAAHSRPILHAVAPPAGAATGPVRERNEKTAQGTIRVVSARYDLTGQRELGLAGDDGDPVGSARCTQRVKFSAEAAAQVKPSLLLCWRTSAGRSVVTLAAVPGGHPSSARSVAAIDKEWAALG